MEERKGHRKSRRIFTIGHSSENADISIRHAAEGAIRRVLYEWEERENGRLAEIPSAIEELVRFYCLDYERRQKALEERTKMREKQKEEESAQKKAVKALDSSEESKKKSHAFTQLYFDLNDNNSLHTECESHRKKKRCKESRRLNLRIKRKRVDKHVLTAPTAVNYRRINMLIDLALSLACDEGVRDTMRHDIAERRGDRRTTLYYLNRRAYLSQKRKAKLAIAAALGLL